MDTALYGPRGFFTAGGGPAAHFRTSVHASPLFAVALLRLLEAVDEALGRPEQLDVVDVGAGRGELLRALAAGAAPTLRRRIRLTGVERAARPAGLPAAIGWGTALPQKTTGLLVATEWLDNVPLDVVEVRGDGTVWSVLVDQDGAETTGARPSTVDEKWLARWWPVTSPGQRAEVGHSRDRAWAAAVSTVVRGFALTVDYGHTRATRPPGGSLAAYRDGRQVPPVPDGSCDITAHVAVDAVAAAGEAAGARTVWQLDQRTALRTLDIRGTRPPLTLASTDPAGYVRALATASQAAELTDPAGLGGHQWLLQSRNVDATDVLPAPR